MVVKIVKGKILIRLLLQKQSDLDLHCMTQSFWEATSFQNSRTFTVNVHLITKILTNEQYKRKIP